MDTAKKRPILRARVYSVRRQGDGVLVELELAGASVLVQFEGQSAALLSTVGDFLPEHVKFEERVRQRILRAVR